MTRILKILLGILTIWPIYYISTGTVNGFRFFGFDYSDNSHFSALPSLIIMFLTGMLLLALTLDYVVNIFKNKRMIKERKTIWIVALCLPLIAGLFSFYQLFYRPWYGSLYDSYLVILTFFIAFSFMIAMPLYWYLHIWKEPKQNQVRSWP